MIISELVYFFLNAGILLVVGFQNKILLVEADQTALRNYQFLLGGCYDVVSSCSVPDGIAILKNIEVDLVIVDHHLPQINGHDFLMLQQITKPEGCIPVIFLSDKEAPFSWIKAVKVGSVAAYLRKPFTVDKLERLVGRILNEGVAVKMISDLKQYVQALKVDAG